MDPHYAALGFVSDDPTFTPPEYDDFAEPAQTVFGYIFPDPDDTLPQTIVSLHHAADIHKDDPAAAADCMGWAVLCEKLLAAPPESMRLFWILVTHGVNPFKAIKTAVAETAFQQAAAAHATQPERPQPDSGTDEGAVARVDDGHAAAVGPSRPASDADHDDSPLATDGWTASTADPHYAGLGIVWDEHDDMANNDGDHYGYMRSIFDNGPDSTLAESIAEIRRKAEEFDYEEPQASGEYMGWAALGDQLLAESPDIMDAFWVLVEQGVSPFRAVKAAAAAATPQPQ